MRLLIIRLSAIGDTVHCLPVAAAIKRWIPEAQVSWLVEPLSAALVTDNPAIDQVFVLPRKEWARALSLPWSWPRALRDIAAFWSAVRTCRFDVALDMQGLLKSALCGAASGAKMRIGFAQTREGAGYLLTDHVDVGDYFAHDTHVIDVNLSVVDYLCARLGIAVPDEEQPLYVPGRVRNHKDVRFPLPTPPAGAAAKVQDLLELPGGAEQASPHAVLIPGTTWPSKIWPLENWARLAVLLVGEGFRVVLAGGAAESATNSQVASRVVAECPQSKVVDLTGRTTLLELIALFERTALVVGSDSGPLHLAAATGKAKVVGIYGSTPWRRLGPYGPQCRSLSLSLWCQPCYTTVCPLGTTACLRDLSVETVYAAIKEHLAESKSAIL